MMDHSRDLAILLGPGTALAQALLSTEWIERCKVVLVARDPRESRSLSSRHPRALVVNGWESEWSLPSGFDSAVVCCCALGLIHPREPEWRADADMTTRDFNILERVVSLLAGSKVHLIFISSVLALSPEGKNLYYAGWKNVIDARISRIIVSHPHCRLSVFYPGRLVKKGGSGRIALMLHASYERMAKGVSRVARSSRSRRAIVGLDARMWLAMQGVAKVLTALTGRVRHADR